MKSTVKFKLKYCDKYFILVAFIIRSSYLEDGYQEIPMEPHVLIIDISLDQMLRHHAPEDGVPDYVKMYNGEENFKAKSSEDAKRWNNLIFLG